MLFGRGSNFQLHIPHKKNISVVTVPIFKLSNNLHCEIKKTPQDINKGRTLPKSLSINLSVKLRGANTSGLSQAGMYRAFISNKE